jgi:hypothetical protein
MFGFGRQNNQIVDSEEQTGAPRLEPKHLFQKRVQRDSARLRAYNQILGQIHTRIFHTSQLPGTANSLVYTVPPFILGLPALDMEDCIVYIVHQLRNSNFEVRFTYPNLLYISWKHYETEYNKLQNPIVKAMAPPPEATSKKGKEGKRGTGDRAPSVTFAPGTAGLGLGGNHAPPRSAMEYQPPDSFLQGIQRPAPKPMGNGTPNSGATDPAADIVAQLWKF